MLNDLKKMLGITDTSKDDTLSLIVSMATARLKRLIGDIDPPDSMRDIIIEVSIARYNRIGSEGLSSHTVDGESMAFSDNDFAPYADDIQAFLDAQNSGKKGRVRFL